jgi:hypothetical protein
MVCVNQTRPHCVNQMGKTQSKALAERHGMCESAFSQSVTGTRVHVPKATVHRVIIDTALQKNNADRTTALHSVTHIQSRTHSCSSRADL